MRKYYLRRKCAMSPHGKQFSTVRKGAEPTMWTDMETLAKQIERQMKGVLKHCEIRDKDLERIWPRDEEDREEKIAEFAKKYGFRLRFYQKGMCALFDKWSPQEHT